LQEVLTGQSHLLDLQGLLAVWFGYRVSAVDGECDEDGVPNVLPVLAQHQALLAALMRDWSVAGRDRDDGTIMVCREGPHDFWCARGSIDTPVLTTAFPGREVEASKRLDRFVLGSFLFAAHLHAPWALIASTASPAGAGSYLRDYAPVTGLVGDDLGGWWVRDDVLVQHFPPIGTLWPQPRLFIHAHDKSAIDRVMSDLLVDRRWSRIDGSQAR
jgi:hypothetical protein